MTPESQARMVARVRVRSHTHRRWYSGNGCRIALRMFSATEPVTCEAQTHAHVSSVLKNAALPQSRLSEHIPDTKRRLLDILT